MQLSHSLTCGSGGFALSFLLPLLCLADCVLSWPCCDGSDQPDGTGSVSRGMAASSGAGAEAAGC